MVGATHVADAANARRIADLRERLNAAQAEAVTNRRADPARELGQVNGVRIALSIEAETHDAASEALGLARASLSAVGSALRSASGTFDTMTESLVAALSGVRDRADMALDADTALSALRSALNTTFAGSYVLSGEATTTQAIAPPADAIVALEDLFTATFGFTMDDPAAAALDAATVAGFLANTAVPELTGTIYDDHLSGAGPGIALRLDRAETVRNETTADADAFREGVAASLLVARFSRSALSDGALAEVTGQALDLAAKAASGIAETQGRLGGIEARVGLAVDAASFARDRASQASDARVAVDPFEAAQRFQMLVTRLETAYALTGRLSELSILNFLPR